MGDDLVAVYEAATMAEAQLLVAKLEGEGVQAFIDNSDSPLDGLTAADQDKIIRVLPSDAELAAQVVEEFQAEAEGP